MKKLLAMLALAVLITGCYAKESNKDYDKTEEPKRESINYGIDHRVSNNWSFYHYYVYICNKSSSVH